MADELLSFLEQRAGDSLRGVATYDEESFEIEYLRSELDEDVVRERTESIHEAVRAGLGPSDVESELGERYATLQVRDEAVIVNLPWGQTSGTFVSPELEAARQLTGFLNECMKRGYPDDIDI